MKLIRDRMPKLEQGVTRQVRNSEEHDVLLRMKLMEEAAEVAAATSQAELWNELGDLYEVMLNVARRNGITFEQIQERAMEKHMSRGGFEIGVVLVEFPLPPTV